MNTRKVVQRLSAGLVLGGEAVGALVIHESHSVTVTAPIVIVAIILTIWLFDSGLDRCVESWNWAANLLGVRPASGVKINGYWYSAVRDPGGTLLGGSVVRIRAGIDQVEFTGTYKDLTVIPPGWSWWSGAGAPVGADAIIYSYKGEEKGKEDEGVGIYAFPKNDLDVITGSFYGKHLPLGERYRTAHGERVPASDLTRDFLTQVDARKEALGRYLSRLPRHTPVPES